MSGAAVAKHPHPSVRPTETNPSLAFPSLPSFCRATVSDRIEKGEIQRGRPTESEVPSALALVPTLPPEFISGFCLVLNPFFLIPCLPVSVPSNVIIGVFTLRPPATNIFICSVGGGGGGEVEEEIITG